MFDREGQRELLSCACCRAGIKLFQNDISGSLLCKVGEGIMWLAIVVGEEIMWLAIVVGEGIMWLA